MGVLLVKCTATEKEFSQALTSICGVQPLPSAVCACDGERAGREENYSG